MKAIDIIERGNELGARLVNGRKRIYFQYGNAFASCNEGGLNPQFEDEEEMKYIELLESSLIEKKKEGV